MSTKFTATNAEFLTKFLNGVNVSNLPPSFGHGNKAAGYKLLSDQVLNGGDCPFHDAKESTVTGWIKNIFNGVESLNMHIAAIESSERVNMDELDNEIELSCGGKSSTLELVKSEWDAQRELGLTLPPSASKSIPAIRANDIKNAADLVSLFRQLCALRGAVSKYKYEKLKKERRESDKKKRKEAAAHALVDPGKSSSDDDDSVSDASDSNSEPNPRTIAGSSNQSGSHNNSKKNKNKKQQQKQQKKKRRVAEGPAGIGQGQTEGTKSASLADMLNKVIESDIARSSATAASSAPRDGNPQEIKAWDFIRNKTSYKDESEVLCAQAQAKLAEEGAQGPSDLPMLGKKVLENFASNLKSIPAKTVLKISECCSQE